MLLTAIFHVNLGSQSPVLSVIMGKTVGQFLAHNSIYATACNMLSPVCPSVTQSKTVEVRIMQPSPQSSPMTLVSWRLTSPQNSKGNIGSGGAEQQRGMKFSANKSPYLRNSARYDQSNYKWLIGSCICAFNWYQNRRLWMTLNCCTFKFSGNFALVGMFGGQQRLNKWRQTSIVSKGIIAH